MAVDLGMQLALFSLFLETSYQAFTCFVSILGEIYNVLVRYACLNAETDPATLPLVCGDLTFTKLYLVEGCLLFETEGSLITILGIGETGDSTLSKIILDGSIECLFSETEGSSDVELLIT